MSAKLIFNNADATPKTVVIECAAASVPDIMAWYGAYFAGDRDQAWALLGRDFIEAQEKV